MMPLGRFCDPLTASGVKTEQKHMLTQHVMITADDDDDNDDKDEEVESTEKKTLLWHGWLCGPAPTDTEEGFNPMVQLFTSLHSFSDSVGLTTSAETPTEDSTWVSLTFTVIRIISGD